MKDSVVYSTCSPASVWGTVSTPAKEKETILTPPSNLNLSACLKPEVTY